MMTIEMQCNNDFCANELFLQSSPVPLPGNWEGSTGCKRREKMINDGSRPSRLSVMVMNHGKEKKKIVAHFLCPSSASFTKVRG